jgi:hypothetical protein
MKNNRITLTVLVGFGFFCGETQAAKKKRIPFNTGLPGLSISTHFQKKD